MMQFRLIQGAFASDDYKESRRSGTASNQRRTCCIACSR